MSTPVTLALFALVALAGCTPTVNVPATTPTIPATTSSITPGSVVTTTTTTAVTTTTIDRVAEIEAIFQDLERRRLQAILDQDEEAFRSVHVDNGYLTESLPIMELVVVVDPNAAVLRILRVIVDRADCIVAEVRRDMTHATTTGGIGVSEAVLERVGDGWGYSWVGKGWRCDGPHPLSG